MPSDRFVSQTQYVTWLGPLALVVRHLCDVCSFFEGLYDVCIVLDTDYRQHFFMWIGVATDVAKMVASDYLMYYFVRSL